MTDKKRCEPPPEWRDRDGWHWVQYKQSPMCRAEWSATEREWFFPEDQTHSPVESLSTSWRYLAPVTPPATVAALEAEVADLRKKQGAWEDDARVWQAEAARLRSAVAVLVEALEHLDFDGAGDAWANLKGAMIDMEHSPTAPPDAVCWRTLNRVLAQLQAARAALAPLAGGGAMSVVTEEMLILVRDAISKANACDGMRDFCKRYGPGACSCMHMAEAALAAVAPLIAAQERARAIAIAQSEHSDAAQDIDMATQGGDEMGRLQSEGAAHAAARIAAAIRALGDET